MSLIPDTLFGTLVVKILCGSMQRQSARPPPAAAHNGLWRQAAGAWALLPTLRQDGVPRREAGGGGVRLPGEIPF